MSATPSRTGHTSSEQPWSDYDYALPIIDALHTALGVYCYLQNTGGGCICVATASLEGGIYLLVGAACDGPLLTVGERVDFERRHGRRDGYAVGVYDHENGYPRAYVVDHLADSPEAVVALARRALTLTAPRGASHYPTWVRNADGVLIAGAARP